MSYNIFNTLSKHIKNINSICQSWHNQFYQIQQRTFKLSATLKDKGGKDDKTLSTTDVETNLDEFSDNLKRTLIPYRTREEKLASSFYSTIQFYGSPRHKTVILFSGDAYLGMCKKGYNIPRIKDMYDAASQYLGIDMYKLSCKGPIRDLCTQTFQQPAIFLASLAASEKLREQNPYIVENCVATAGWSIGELTSLVFAGSLSFESGLRLAMIRGEAMHVASEEIIGGLMKVYHYLDANIKTACEYAVSICREDREKVISCDIASFISPGCKILGGNVLALKYLQLNGNRFRLYKAESITESGAFHTTMMNIAVQPFSKYVVNTDFEDPLIPVYANDTGNIYETGEHVRQRFGQQFCKPVRWEEIIYNIYSQHNDDLSETYICGPSKFLKSTLAQNYSFISENCNIVEI